MIASLVERHLAAALRNEPEPWPASWAGESVRKQVMDEIVYHGVAGLLVEKLGALEDWPDDVITPVRQQALGQAMWELQHSVVLGRLVRALDAEGIEPLFLKGTAIAYDLYDQPAARSRGDTDLLIHKNDVGAARTVLESLGFKPSLDLERDSSTDNLLQQSWTLLSDDGLAHHMDLHWQVMNVAAFKDVLTYAECAAASIPLPRLEASARALDRVRTLLHTALHRAMHLTSPYFAGGKTYYGSDRLIWTHDIHLLASSLTKVEWQRLCALCREHGASAVCLDGLTAARRALGTFVPDEALEALRTAPRRQKTSQYLLQSRQLGRAWQDLLATHGTRRKLAYVRSRILPPSLFVRAKYENQAQGALAKLYVRRIVDLIRTRPRGRARR
jgi:hypothetical protein